MGGRTGGRTDKKADGWAAGECARGRMDRRDRTSGTGEREGKNGDGMRGRWNGEAAGWEDGGGRKEEAKWRTSCTCRRFRKHEQTSASRAPRVCCLARSGSLNTASSKRMLSFAPAHSCLNIYSRA